MVQYFNESKFSKHNAFISFYIKNKVGLFHFENKRQQRHKFEGTLHSTCRVPGVCGRDIISVPMSFQGTSISI